MTLVAFGDLVQSYLLKSQTARLKSEAGRITKELSSGRLSDVGSAVSGDFTRLSALSRSRTLTESYLFSAREGAAHTNGLQAVIASVGDSAQSLTPSLLASPLLAPNEQVALIGQEARARFDSVLSKMNTSLAGRSLLAGQRVTAAAVADGETILTALRAEVAGAGAATADDIMARLATWFTNPTGYEAVAYQGGPALGDLAISASESAWIGVTAEDPAFRAAILGFAAAALVSDSALALPDSLARDLARRAGEHLVSAQDQLTELAARVGVSEAKIEAAQSHNSAELLSLEMAQADIVQSDPYRLATELEAVQTNLETVYAITARLSRLSLTDFLR